MKLSKVFLLTCLMFPSFLNVNAEEVKKDEATKEEAKKEDSKEKAEEEVLEARTSAAAGGQFARPEAKQVFVYSASKIVAAEYENGTDGWKAMTKMTNSPHPSGFFTDVYFNVPEKRTVKYRLTYEDGHRITDEALLVKDEDGLDVEEVHGVKTESAEEVKKSKSTVTQTSNNQNIADSQAQIFVNLLNNYRAQRGLGMVSYDANLSNHAQMNNNVYHRTRQPHGHSCGCSGNWAGVGYAQGAFNMWLASPPHHANMLKPASRVGIAFSGNSSSMFIQ